VLKCKRVVTGSPAFPDPRTAPLAHAQARVLTPEAVEFVAGLARSFGGRVKERLAARHARQARLDAGTERFDFLAETASVRAGDWKVAPLPEDLLDRRVEITGPVERKMIINALNSGASVFMADFEDSTSPTWENLVVGQANLEDAVRRTIRYTAPETGKSYVLNEKTAVLMVRPRGWHLEEAHMKVDGAPVPGALFDFGLYLFHNAKELLARGTGPYFYLPKMESHLEARLWNDVFVFAEDALGLRLGTIKATCLVETLPAAFEMDEILYELRDHSAGLNCGRWDYIFSFIKKRAMDPAAVLPDRAEVTMDKGFLRAYVELLIQTCHRRGVHAMGGMAAQIPIKEDPAANEAALAKVRADKLREVGAGHDGTWVAHPGLVGLAREMFDRGMPGKNQIAVSRPVTKVTREDLLRVPEGHKTEKALRHNVKVGIRYLEAWLCGNGCVPLYHLMEDAATAEISRAQAWQWLHHGARLDGADGPLTRAAFLGMVEEEMHVVRREVGEARFEKGKFAEARALFERLSVSESFTEFLTLPAYEALMHDENPT
jgi:malate synthase